jgi:putative tricarboxylic transport membrane protein
VLGRLMEEKLRQALVISRGSFMTFVERPLSGGPLLLALILVVIAILPSIRKGREEVFQEAGQAAFSSALRMASRSSCRR